MPGALMNKKKVSLWKMFHLSEQKLGLSSRRWNATTMMGHQADSSSGLLGSFQETTITVTQELWQVVQW